MNKNRRLVKGIVLVIFVLSAIIAVGAIRKNEKSELPYWCQVERRTFKTEVHTIGELDAARSHMIASSIKGDKAKIIYLINDGEKVEEGDVLVRLDPTEFEKEIFRLEGEVLALTAALEASEQVVEWDKNQIEKEIKTAGYNSRVAALEVKKIMEGEGPLQLSRYREEMEKIGEERSLYESYLKDLHALKIQGYDNQSEIQMAIKKLKELNKKFETANVQYSSYKNHVLPTLIETARAKLEQSEMEFEQLKKGSAFKIAKSVSSVKEFQGKLQTTKIALDQAKMELSKTIIYAPFHGIAILYETFRDGKRRKPRVGDRVWQDQPLLYLPDISTMVVNTNIREIDLHKISIGYPCKIQVDAYPDVLHTGKVGFIGALATEPINRGTKEKFFHMEVFVEGGDMRLRPGMTARVTINTGSANRTIAVPVNAIFYEESDPFCYRKTESGSEKTPVKVGLQNENWVEILKGLVMGDRVALVNPETE